MSYLNRVLDCDTLEKTSARLAGLIKSTGIEFSNIAVTGLSGTLMAGPLSLLLNKQIIVLRKQGERSHGSSIEAHCAILPAPYIIVDDGIATGETILTIIREMRPYQGECKGIFLYNPDFGPMVGEYRFTFEEKLLELTGLSFATHIFKLTEEE